MVGLVIIAAVIGAWIRLSAPRGIKNSSSETGTATLHVVAAENFWGSIAAQIGGTHVHVVSIISNPNIDPHEYESNAADARAVAQANYVIENGAGYDSWMGKLVSAGNVPHRTVLNVATLLGKHNGDNPHFWYDPAYVNRVAVQIEKDLIALDPAHAAAYKANYAALQSSFTQYQQRIAAIKAQFGGTKVAATEDIFVYLANATGLDLVSPPAFIQAVAEGNDPPAESVIQFENQLRQGNVHVLVYNKQTVTPLTQRMKTLATQQGIPTVGITETIQPPTYSFEEWMNGELIQLQNALSAHATSTSGS